MRGLRFLFALGHSNRAGILLPRVRMSRIRMASSTKNRAIVVDPFCHRQFAENEASKSYGGTVFSNSMQEFTDIVNERYDESNLKDGYAPFCKHLFLVNDFTDARVNVLPITSENESLLRTKYEARTEKEVRT
mmetsp:Transcript_7994/g.18532  ORF Transcript_7994/g.18532 Transcript_7994/m.18532 type:complete len:133 (-) Transcript_7994:1806-2204(-)